MCIRDRLRTVNLLEIGQTMIRNGNHANIWFDGAEWIVGGLCAGVGDCIK